jgi:hypothetical protein
MRFSAPQTLAEAPRPGWLGCCTHCQVTLDVGLTIYRELQRGLNADDQQVFFESAIASRAIGKLDFI